MNDVVSSPGNPIGVMFLAATSSHLALGDFPLENTLEAISAAADGQSLGCRWIGEQLDDGVVIAQGLTAPVGANEGKEAHPSRLLGPDGPGTPLPRDERLPRPAPRVGRPLRGATRHY